MERKVIPRAQAQGTGVILRSIFLQGVLSHRLDSLPTALDRSVPFGRSLC